MRNNCSPADVPQYLRFYFIGFKPSLLGFLRYVVKRCVNTWRICTYLLIIILLLIFSAGQNKKCSIRTELLIYNLHDKITEYRRGWADHIHRMSHKDFLFKFTNINRQKKEVLGSQGKDGWRNRLFVLVLGGSRRKYSLPWWLLGPALWWTILLAAHHLVLLPCPLRTC